MTEIVVDVWVRSCYWVGDGELVAGNGTERLTNL